jgi:hypothetical protein
MITAESSRHFEHEKEFVQVLHSFKHFLHVFCEPDSKYPDLQKHFPFIRVLEMSEQLKQKDLEEHVSHSFEHLWHEKLEIEENS